MKTWDQFQLRIQELVLLDGVTKSTIWSHINQDLSHCVPGHADEDLEVVSPVDGKTLAHVKKTSKTDREESVHQADEIFRTWRSVPAPKRGELIRLFGERLRENKEALAYLITLEMGKTLQESKGEVQEMIDICDFAVGLSRQLHGLTIASERKNHRLQETWHPLGPVLVISAFNFPTAVWAWNFTLAVVCGNPVVWKPSEKTPLTAIMCHRMFQDVAIGYDAEQKSSRSHWLSQLVIGGVYSGQQLVDDERLKLVSATGSTKMGNIVGINVAERFGRSLLELGGNNAMIITPSADQKQALTAAVFSAVGTTGQRCTTLRRLFIQEQRYEFIKTSLAVAYSCLLEKIGNPLLTETMIGPLLDRGSYENMWKAMEQAKREGGKIIFGGGRVCEEDFPLGYYVYPAIIEMPEQTAIVKQETFAPILYLMKYKTLDEAIFLQNDVDQGLSSSIFTQDMREAEQFLSARGSDCGIANVNVGTSGAEIGGAFGGEKHTGGGRESGSDSWKNYMRRQTATINYGNPREEAELSQGIKFELIEPPTK